MKKNKLLFILLLLVCLTAMIISVYKVARSKTTFQQAHEQALPTSQMTAVSSADASVTTNEKTVGINKLTPLSDEEFTNWIRHESKQLEGSTQDEKQVEAVVREKALRLTESQIKELKSIVENKDEAINKRIFSNYVLTNSFTLLTDQILTDLIFQSTDHFKQAKESHSVDEVKRSQEYALRFMQIDEMVQRLQQKGDDPLAFLIDLSRKSNDSQIKSYALQKIRIITGQK